MRVNYNVKIAVLIRALRNALAMSQTDLADAANCSRPTINRIEALDKASPRGSTVDDLFQVFREMGVEIQMGDEEVSVKFPKTALLKAEERIKLGQIRSSLEDLSDPKLTKSSPSN